MNSKNLISVEFSQSQVSEIIDNINKIKNNLPAGLVTLTSDERRAYIKMGDKTVAFVQKAFDYANILPDMLPAYISVAEMKKDLEAVKTMLNILNRLEEIYNLLDDSILLAGSEAYTAALSIYYATKDATRRNVTGAKTAAQELKERFPGKKQTAASQNQQ